MGVIYRKEGRFCCGCDQTGIAILRWDVSDGFVFRLRILTTFHTGRDQTLRSALTDVVHETVSG